MVAATQSFQSVINITRIIELKRISYINNVSLNFQKYLTTWRFIKTLTIGQIVGKTGLSSLGWIIGLAEM